MHPPFGVPRALHDWLREPVYTIVGLDIACDMTIHINKGHMSTRNIEQSNHSHDDDADADKGFWWHHGA
jgi:hypothetical protein